jgi:hypothetical protein
MVVSSGSNDNDNERNDATNNPISSWVNSLKVQFDDIVDEQRMERLQSCRIIEDVYAECRKYQKLKLDQERTMHLEDFPPGIRILRYYDWRNIHDYDHKCAREKHAIWACRAGALQCGGELVQLRNCFNNVQQPPPGTSDPIHTKNHGAVLNTSATAYEPKQRNIHKNIPCRDFQEKMGACIATNASALAEREVKRSKRAQEKEKI